MSKEGYCGGGPIKIGPMFGWDAEEGHEARGPSGGPADTIEGQMEQLRHLTDWMEQCLRKENPRDPAGNIYCGVDSHVVKEAIVELGLFRCIIAEHPDELLPYIRRYTRIYAHYGKSCI